ncbi:sensor histidine kinase [Oceanidesulfovibrio marinus]|uniref:histidine kinase n=1 Tax=Oceanidesulfovibrio marinus TaxID=370038 RepID=A0ABX6NJ09_9BACT|nr:HAMP domain-containing sensor histidine kinase [Oceanidesulfovibrio marinus]QJT09717.1 HAMP domain-containing histidine kinase [Oceanidesulfovibrio marinus]
MTDTPAETPSRYSRMRTFWRSIKGKIFLVFFSTFISVAALTLLNYWSMSMVTDRLHLLERYEDLLNNVLEVRRFEKNFLFYNDPTSLQESLEYLQRIDVIFEELGADIRQVIGNVAYRQLTGVFLVYEDIIEEARDEPVAHQEQLRSLGKELVESADALLKNKRERIHRAVVRTSFIPFTSLVVFGLLMFLVVKLISRGLLVPLATIKVTTQRVARGDFRPISPTADQIEEIAGLIGAFNRMAQELEANQEDLLQARKIAALGTFTAGIAHELNNPINNISLSAETLGELYGEELDEDANEMVHDIIMQSERAGEIVKNLLDFSRTERPAFSPLQVLDVIDSTVTLIKNQLMVTGVTLDMDIPEDIPDIQGNLRNLQQVFMNLLLNAIQAMPGGGAITIAAREQGQKMVRIEVRDTGAGIDPKVLEHIFEPFFTTKEVGKGTGLGLAVMYSIVQRHGGRVEVKSEPGKGSVFAVILPRAEQ